MASADKRHKSDANQRNPAVPAVLTPKERAPIVSTEHGAFDLDNPALPAWLDKQALSSGGYPYGKAIDDDLYEAQLAALQIELVKLQRHINNTGARIVAAFEGRDAAGKGSAIFVIRRYMNPRTARVAALPKPNELERGQWYFQRYVAHLPAAGELVLFDRSWYNRAGVERVMGFATLGQSRAFLADVPHFEAMLADEGIVLFKFWLDIGREMQLKRFHERRHNPLKIWKLSPIDLAALTHWDTYTAARDEMLAASHRPATPWTVVRANDKRRARLNLIRHMLRAIDYPGRDDAAVGPTDPLILGGPDLADGVSADTA